jgi:hypothetical protein
MNSNKSRFFFTNWSLKDNFVSLRIYSKPREEKNFNMVKTNIDIKINLNCYFI